MKTVSKYRYNQHISLYASITLLIVIATLLRFYRLDQQLWLDEISALTGNYRKPFIEILTTFPGFFPHPLYELMAHASLVILGESAIAIRLPAALFGVAGVIIFFRLARRLANPGEAFLASVLFAVSYHHIFYSQNARGYTVFIFFALISTDLFLRLLQTMRWRTAFAFVGVAALTAYAQPFGLFVPIGQMMVAFPVVWIRRRGGDRSAPSLVHLLGIAVLTSFTIVIMYAPFIRDSIAFSLTSARAEGHGLHVFALLPELLEGLLGAFHGWSGLIIAVVFGTIGIFSFIRSHPVAMAALLLPSFVSAATVILLGAGVHPRYFLLVLPVGYLVLTRGMIVVSRTVLERRLRLPEATTAWVKIAMAVFLVVLAMFPLYRYYSFPKQDYLGALQQIHTLATGDDRTVAVDLAGHAIRAYYAPDFPVVENLSELLHEEATGKRVWAVTTLERVQAKRDPNIMTHLHQHYQLLKVLPGTLGDGAMRIYMRETIDTQGSMKPYHD